MVPLPKANLQVGVVREFLVHAYRMRKRLKSGSWKSGCMSFSTNLSKLDTVRLGSRAAKAPNVFVMSFLGDQLSTKHVLLLFIFPSAE